MIPPYTLPSPPRKPRPNMSDIIRYYKLVESIAAEYGLTCEVYSWVSNIRYKMKELKGMQSHLVRQSRIEIKSGDNILLMLRPLQLPEEKVHECLISSVFSDS